jgi:hypothetical protein
MREIQRVKEEVNEEVNEGSEYAAEFPPWWRDIDVTL